MSHLSVIPVVKDWRGDEVLVLTYRSDKLEATFCNVGASIVSLKTKDNDGQWADIVLGYDDYLAYTTNTDNYMGSVVGRYANRIKEGRFSLHGKTYQLSTNNGVNHLHGGDTPINTKVWSMKETPNGVIFQLSCADGEGNYPGNVDLTVTYEINGNELLIRYEGVSDQDTIVNLTNHTYFNLDGHDFGSLKHHSLQVDARLFLPIDDTMIPTGEILSVDDTPFDFQTEKPLLADIEQDDVQLLRANGYDHTFVLVGKAVLSSQRSGRYVSVQTNMPGIQVYTGNYLNCTGKQGAHYGFRSGVALETQYFPNSINQPNFMSPILKKEERYCHEARFTFGLISD